MKNIVLGLLSGALFYGCAAPPQAAVRPRTYSSTPPARIVVQHSAPTLRTINNTAHLLAELNRYRQQHGLRALVISPTATAAARLQASYNLEHHTHGHANPRYPEPADRLVAVGHQYEPTLYYTRYCREVCIQVERMTPRYLLGLDSLLMTNYKNSLHHNTSLLDAEVRKVGITTLYDGTELQNTIVLCI